MKQKIYIGADHAGFALKEEIKKFFDAKKINYIDLGNSELDPKDDYPDFGFKVAEKVATDAGSMGILACGSSEGVCIAANKAKGARAVSVFNIRDAKLVRQHNDANILCLSGWHLPASEAKKIVLTFLNTKKSLQLRHLRRVSKIIAYEKKHLS